MSIRFFLGANTPNGFRSFYDEFIDLKLLRSKYIIKGTPGCGKSSFMRRVAEALEVENSKIEYIHCSGDPESLDAIWLPEQKTAFMDGTAPHVVEPVYPLIIDHYLHLGDTLPGIDGQRNALISLFNQHKEVYSRIYRCLTAIRALQEDSHFLVLNQDTLNKINRRVKGIISREIKRGAEPLVMKRYLNAITPKGELIFWETVDYLAKRVYLLENNLGFSPYMLAPILKAGIDAGQHIYACYNPFAGESALEHIIFPNLSLAFISVKNGREYPGEAYRHIRLDASVPASLIKNVRTRLRFARKTEKAILEEVQQSLGQVKLLHDKIEACYHPYINFSSVQNKADNIIEQLLN